MDLISLENAPPSPKPKRKKTGGVKKGYRHDELKPWARLVRTEARKKEIDQIKDQGYNAIKSLLVGVKTTLWHPSIPCGTTLTEAIIDALPQQMWLTIPVHPKIGIPIRQKLESLWAKIDDMQRRMYAGKDYIPVPKKTLIE